MHASQWVSTLSALKKPSEDRPERAALHLRPQVLNNLTTVSKGRKMFCSAQVKATLITLICMGQRSSGFMNSGFMESALRRPSASRC